MTPAVDDAVDTTAEQLEAGADGLHVFMVVGALRRGGMTAAMMNRARMFTERGIPSTIVTLQPDPELDERRSEYLAMGWLDPRVQVVNAFEPASPSGRSRARRWSLRGRVLVWAPPATGRGRRLYTSPGAWFTAYLTRLARTAAGDAVIVCDGPGSAEHVLRVPRSDAATLFMVHNNHLTSPWTENAEPRADCRRIFESSAAMDGLVVLTAEQAEDIARSFGNAASIRVVPNSVAQGPVVPDTAGRADLTVSMFARLVNQKNLDDAVAVFAEVVARVPGARLDIYGKGYAHRRLRADIRARGLTSAVRLRGYTTDAPAAMARSALVLCTSHFEGLPVSFLEAYRAGTPVVSYDCKYGPRDLVDDGVTGFLVPRGDRAALADRVVELLQDPGLARSMGSAGRARILGRYANDVVFDAWWKVLSEARANLSARRRR